MAMGGAFFPRFDLRQQRDTIGVAVILTNNYVGCPEPEKWKQLPGTNKDQLTWKTALQNLLFDVRSFTNLTKEQTIHLLQHVSTLNMSAASSSPVKQHLVFVYCGHGEKDYIICQDGQSLETDQVCEPFLQHPCGTAVAKLLFFDACRGEKRDKGRVYGRSASEPAPRRVAERGGTSAQGALMPTKGNYLVVFSTLPDYIAQELLSSPSSPSHGMWSELFAPKLAACNMSLTSLIAEVNRVMLYKCRDLLSQPQSPNDATFQVTETSKCTLIGDVNLCASAAQLRQLLSQMSMRGPQVPSVTLPRTPPSPAPSRINYRSRFNNDFKQRYQLRNVVETPTPVEGGYTFCLQVEWEGRRYTQESQWCRTKEDAKEEACRLMVELLEAVVNQGSQPLALPTNLHVAPPTNLHVALPMGQPGMLSVSHGQSVDHTVMPRPPAVPLVMSRGAKKYQELLNECRQKVENAGGSWSLMGEPENVAQTTFQCQLMLFVTPSAGAKQLHLMSKLVEVVGRKSESKERAAQDLVRQLQERGILKLN